MEQEPPSIKKIENIMRFAQSHEKLYIFGINHASQMLYRFLQQFSLRLDMVLVTEEQKKTLDMHESSSLEVFKHSPYEGVEINTPNWAFQHDCDKEQTGIFIAGNNRYINENVACVLHAGYLADNLYILDEETKSGIAYKLTARDKMDFHIEIHVADHCNLNCAFCNHYAQLARPHFTPLEQFEKDMKRMGELFDGTVGFISLLGGEPLLNKDLPVFIRTVRKYFPDTSLRVLTNGILLKRCEEMNNLWATLHQENAGLAITDYPIHISIDEILQLGEKWGVPIHKPPDSGNRAEFIGEKQMVVNPFSMDGNVEKWEYICCWQFNNCFSLRNGRLYTCPICAYIDFFNDYFKVDMKQSAEDYIDIYQAKSWRELTEFMAHRIPFCNYCKISHRHFVPWRRSEKLISEYLF